MKKYRITTGFKDLEIEANNTPEAIKKAILAIDPKRFVEVKEIEDRISFTRIKNDTNGNPRYVCHFLNFITEEDEKNIDYTSLDFVSRKYAIALEKAKKIGGRKFHNKQYGGGIVFQSYNIQETERRIKELLETGK